MAKQKSDVNKSEEVRQLLKANPEMPVKEIVETMAGRGRTVTPNLVYFIKGRMSGRKARKKKAQKMVAQVATATTSTNSDALKTILKVKSWADEVGGMKKLKALVEALIV